MKVVIEVLAAPAMLGDKLGTLATVSRSNRRMSA
jgi:hypothetical protein